MYTPYVRTVPADHHTAASENVMFLDVIVMADVGVEIGVDVIYTRDVQPLAVFPLSG